jgi:hypothetical protein
MASSRTEVIEILRKIGIRRISVSGDKILTVYKIRHRNNSEWLIADDDRDFERLHFDGKPRASSWSPVAVSILKALMEAHPGRMISSRARMGS